MATHELKTWPGPFSAVLLGEKPFEWRKDDRTPRYETGDILVLREFIPCANCAGSGRVPDPGSHGESDACACLETPTPYGKHTQRQLEVRVTYILRREPGKASFGMPEGYVVMGIKPMRRH